jgi:agmatine/peptidylarginine deiminase
MTANQAIVTPDWEDYLNETAKKILEQQTPQRCVGAMHVVRC